MKTSCRALVMLLLAGSLGCATPDDSSPAAEEGDRLGSRSESSAIVERVGDLYLDKLTEISPFINFRRGEPVTSLPDLSLEASQDLASFAQGQLDRLAAIDEGAIDHEEWISLELLRWNLGLLVEAPRHYWADFNITPYAGGGFVLNTIHQIFGAAPLGTEEELTRYLDLLDEYAGMIEQFADKVDGQKERGIYLPKTQVPNVRGMFSGYRDRRTELLRPATARLEGARQTMGEGPVDDFSTKVELALGERVEPAFARLLASLGDDYLAAAPEQVGLRAVPGGEELYRYRVRSHSTTTLSPEEIHEIGQAEVARLSAEMKQIREQLGFEGSMADFYEFARTDQRFIAESPAEVEERYMSYIERIEPLVPLYFSVLPEAPYGVRRLDPTAEATMTFGVYQPPSGDNPRGEYRYNGSDLENRSLFPAGPLIYHELVPGHHFQIALANEREDLPRFRRESISYSAFTEGWAEYAANLGKEMGLYDDPYDLYARLSTEMFMSCRLVLDTGMNHLGWSLEQAREFMTGKVIYSDVEIATELLRYSADIHGQALGYRMGLLEITRLREQAEQELGDAFDIRSFHAAVIGSGAMPMTVLARHIDWWIGQQKGSAG